MEDPVKFSCVRDVAEDSLYFWFEKKTTIK